MLLNMPKSSLTFNAGLALSCVLCAMPDPNPYFPLWSWQLAVLAQRCSFSLPSVSQVTAAAVIFLCMCVWFVFMGWVDGLVFVVVFLLGFFLVLGVWRIGLWKLCAGVEASLYPGNGGVRLLGACTLDGPIPDSAAPAHVAWMVMILSFDLMSATVFSLNCGFISGLSGEWTEWKAL